MLLLPGQEGASSAPRLHLGSPQSGSSVSRGDEVDVQQGSQARALQAPLVALQATSFLDMGAPTEAVLPAAAPSQGEQYIQCLRMHPEQWQPVCHVHGIV